MRRQERIRAPEATGPGAASGEFVDVEGERYYVIRDVDRIYVMHRGEICEHGSHQELLTQRGLYWRLYQLQFAQQEGAAA